MALCNAWAARELVFDGHSVVGRAGDAGARGQFAEELLVCDLRLPAGPSPRSAELGRRSGRGDVAHRLGVADRRPRRSASRSPTATRSSGARPRLGDYAREERLRARGARALGGIYSPWSR